MVNFISAPRSTNAPFLQMHVMSTNWSNLRKCISNSSQDTNVFKNTKYALLNYG